MKKVIMLVLAMVLLVSTFAIAAPIDISDDVWQKTKNEYTVLITDVPIETQLLLKMEAMKWVFVTVVKHEGNFHWYFTRPIQMWLWGEPHVEQPDVEGKPVPTFNLK